MSKEESAYFIIIPAPVKTSKILSPQAKLLFGEIAVKCNVKGYCWATNQYFADVFDCNVRSIQRYIKELEDANFVEIELIEDAEKGVIRRIRATVLSQYVATVLSHVPTTEMSLPPTTDQTRPHDIADVTPHDKNVIKNNKNLDNKNYNKKEKTKEAQPVNGSAGHVNGSEQSLFEIEPIKTNSGKKEKGTAPQKEKKPPTVFHEFIRIYDEWHKQENEGMPPVIDGKNGQAAKSIISHLRKSVQEKAKRECVQMDLAGEESGILAGWQYILNNWNRIEIFYQQKTRLIDINSNLQIILKQVRNGNGTNKAGNNGATSGKFADNRTTEQRFNSINEKYSSWENN